MKPSSQSNSKQLPPEPHIAEPLAHWAFEAIGTKWWIGIYESITHPVLGTVQTMVADRINEFDKVYSRFRTDSLVTKISRHAGEYAFPSDAEELFRLYRQMYEATDGRVTPLIGGALSDAGYDASYSLQPKPVRDVPAWDDVMSFSSGVLRTKQPVLLDFGAAGKGYLVDIVCELLKAQGVNRFCVDAGGDMRCTGLQVSLQVGLENPENSEEAIGIAQLQDQALCGSAGNRRAWGTYHHVLDPQLLESPKHIKAVWVSADSAALADGLTTALFFSEPEKLLKTFNYSWLILYADGSASKSANFPAQLFT